MRRLVLVLCLVWSASSAAGAQTTYRTPPQVVIDILDAPPPPAVSVSPDRQWLLLLEQRSMPTIAELTRPILRPPGNPYHSRNNRPNPPSLLPHLALMHVAAATQ